MLATKHVSWYTVSRMKQVDLTSVSSSKRKPDVSDYIWETFDSLFKTVGRQGRRVEELEARIADLERRLNERQNGQPQTTPQPFSTVNEMPAERAA